MYNIGMNMSPYDKVLEKKVAELEETLAAVKQPPTPIQASERKDHADSPQGNVKELEEMVLEYRKQVCNRSSHVGMGRLWRCREREGES